MGARTEKEIELLWAAIDDLKNDNFELQHQADNLKCQVDELEAYVENLEFDVEDLSVVVYQLDYEVEDIVEVINNDIEASEFEVNFSNAHVTKDKYE